MEHTATRLGEFQHASEDSPIAPTTYRDIEFLFRVLRGRGHEYEHYESSFERTVSDVLIAEKINFLYEPLKFRIHESDKLRSWERTYTPDFLLNMRIDGKIVLVEAKGRKYFDDHIFTKYSLFMQQYSDRVYFIIITDMPDQSIVKRLCRQEEHSEIANEIWNVSHIHQGYNWEEYEEKEKEFIRRKLKELMEKPSVCMLRKKSLF